MFHGTAIGGDGRRSFKVGEPPIGEEKACRFGIFTGVKSSRD
jgi:hypothetical protein